MRRRRLEMLDQITGNDTKRRTRGLDRLHSDIRAEQGHAVKSHLYSGIGEQGSEVDSFLEARTWNIIIGLLDNTESYILASVICCVAALVPRVHEQRVVELTDKLCNRVITGDWKVRDKASITLLEIVNRIWSEHLLPARAIRVAICKKITRALVIKGMRKEIRGEMRTEICKMRTEIKCRCLEVIRRVIKVGHDYINLDAPDYAALFHALLLQLNIDEASVRENAVSCVASLPSSLSDDLLAEATSYVIRLLNRATTSEIKCTNIKMIGELSIAVGSRFGPHLGDVVPTLINFLKNAPVDHGVIHTCSFEVFKGFLLRHTGDMCPYSDEILSLTLTFLHYDPSLIYATQKDIDDNTEEGSENTEEESSEDRESGSPDSKFSEELEDNERNFFYSSRKVRKAAADCIACLIDSQPDLLSRLYEKAYETLIDRFEERDETVKIVIFGAFIKLLRQTENVMKSRTDFDESRPRYLLKQKIPGIIQSVNKQLRNGSNEAKSKALSILNELANIFPDCLADHNHLGALLVANQKALSAKSSTLKIEGLMFTRLLLGMHDPSIFHPHIKAISELVISAVRHGRSEVKALSLRALEDIIRIAPNSEVTDLDFEPCVLHMCSAIFSCLDEKIQSIAAISCMGRLVSTFGDRLGEKLPSCLIMIVNRMGDEITFFKALEAFSEIVVSPGQIDVSCVLEDAIRKVVGFLRMELDGKLARTALGTLNTLVDGYSDKIHSTSYESIVDQLPNVMRDTHWHGTALALELCCKIMAAERSGPGVRLIVKGKVLPQVLTLIQSSWFHKRLPAVQNFFREICSINTSFDELVDLLLSRARQSAAVNLALSYPTARCLVDLSHWSGREKRSYVAHLFPIAQCLADLAVWSGSEKCSYVVDMLTHFLKASTDLVDRQLSLLCLGEIGSVKDLSCHYDIENIVMECLHYEEIRIDACFALAHISVGNLQKYLPIILDKIDNEQKDRYLICSLTEVIASQSVDVTEFDNSTIERIINLLFKKSRRENRYDVARCLGQLALMLPEKLVPVLKERKFSPAASARATVASAVRYFIVNQQAKIDDLLYSEIQCFLMLIVDQDLDVRKEAVEALRCVASFKPNLIKGSLLQTLLPPLYNQTVIPGFEGVEERGVETMSDAFRCVWFLFETFPDEVKVSFFIEPYLLHGLYAHDGVQRICHGILLMLADKFPSDVLPVLDLLAFPLRKSIRAGCPWVDIDTLLEAIAALDRIRQSGAYRGQQFHFEKLMKEILNSRTLSGRYSSIRNK